MEREDLIGLVNKLQTAEKFKNPNRKKTRRRYKSLRQVVKEENKRIQAEREESKDKPHDFISYDSIVAPPSLKPLKTYCDITGLPTSYKSPNTRIRFYNKECFDMVKSLPPGVDQQYLALRNANVILK